MSNNAHELSNRLLNALDSNYNVVDMRAVNEIISILERINITKELLETTRLGKHVNELRRKTTDPTLARRAKVLLKRWRDMVIPNVASPAHIGSNRSSAERQVRRLGGTPLTSPALSRQVVSPAVPSPRPSSRPAWGGYESDSQDVILVDDDPPPPPPAPAPLANASHKPLLPTSKRPLSPSPAYDDKKAKRDKKPKKRRGHSRAGAGTETAGGEEAGEAWGGRNGAERRNGCRPHALDRYSALVNRIPPAGAKKVKTTKELLEEIQSRGSKPAPSPGSPRSPASPDVMLIEPDPHPVVKVESPLRNGEGESRPPSPAPLPLEDERPHAECVCGTGADGEACGDSGPAAEPEASACPAARRRRVRPLHVRALLHAYLPGVNGTRAPPEPHRFAVRPPLDPDNPDLFTSVVPLYKYSDYADDYCAKNMSRVPLCTHLPWTEFAPSPPELPPPKSPPPLRPYPVDSPEPGAPDEPNEDDVKDEVEVEPEQVHYECPKIEPEMVGLPALEPSERLKAPILSTEDETQFTKCESDSACKMEVDTKQDFQSEEQDHRTVERTKRLKTEEASVLDGRTLYSLCKKTLNSVPYDYSQASAAPVVTLPEDPSEASGVLEAALVAAGTEDGRDALGRPPRPPNFAEWHECAKLGDLIALPYVVID